MKKAINELRNEGLFRFNAQPNNKSALLPQDQDLEVPVVPPA
jgi:hypothetical protein